jgi:hypothetical protein
MRSQCSARGKALSTDGRPEITATFQRSKPRWAATVSAEACVSMDTHAMAAPPAGAGSNHVLWA